jgi:hypothetical protein
MTHLKIKVTFDFKETTWHSDGGEWRNVGNGTVKDRTMAGSHYTILTDAAKLSSETNRLYKVSYFS